LVTVKSCDSCGLRNKNYSPKDASSALPKPLVEPSSIREFLMKQILVILSSLLVSSFAFAADEVQPQQQQQYQPVCVNEAAQAAQILFSLNNGGVSEFNTEYLMVDAAPVEEGGYEVFDFTMTLTDGTKSTPYRVTTAIAGCKVISFETPFAN
jgi:hypothetical protein